MTATPGKAASEPGEEFLHYFLPKPKKSHFYDTTTKASILSGPIIHFNVNINY